MAMRWVLLVLALAAGAMALAAGCSSSATSAEGDPTTRALNDPMNYSPDADQDVTGGGLTDFHGDAFKKDMDHVLNP
jgi:hypothetical protein